MRTATLRDLRNNFSRLEAWLAEGQQIQIEKRGEPIALLTGLTRRGKRAYRGPNFAARRRAIWGDRVFDEAEIARMRDAEREGEDG